MNHSFNYILTRYPFVINTPKMVLTHEIFQKIYKDSDSFKKGLENYTISEKKYSINFKDEENTVNIQFFQEKELIYTEKGILKKPFEIYFENIDEIVPKEIKIFNYDSYNKLKYFLQYMAISILLIIPNFFSIYIQLKIIRGLPKTAIKSKKSQSS